MDRRNFKVESAESSMISNAKEAANLLKQLGFHRGKSFRGIRSAHYYIGNNCGVLLHSSGIFFPKKYYVSNDIINSDYTIKNTLPTFGFSQTKGYKISDAELDELVAYTLLNNGRDVTLFFPVTISEIETHVRLAQEDGFEVRAAIEQYLNRINKKESLLYRFRKIKNS